MKIFKSVPQIDFMGKKKLAFIFSALFLILALGGFLTKGLKYGIDFKGGTLVQIQFEQEPELKKVRELFQGKLDTEVIISKFGEEANNEVLVTLSQDAIKGTGGELTAMVKDILQSSFKNFDIRRVDTVGPKVGSELKDKSYLAALYAFIGILIYIGFRFKVKYGVAAVVAIFHDVLITMGIFVVADKEFTLTIVAAVLTIIGYSLNDTIIVFDRIRENIKGTDDKAAMPGLFNKSINETLSRTILTSLTTLIVLLALFFLGGEIIHNFALAMIIGVIIGTFSSIFVATPIVLAAQTKG